MVSQKLRYKWSNAFVPGFQTQKVVPTTTLVRLSNYRYGDEASSFGIYPSPEACSSRSPHFRHESAYAKHPTLSLPKISNLHGTINNAPRSNHTATTMWLFSCTYCLSEEHNRFSSSPDTRTLHVWPSWPPHFISQLVIFFFPNVRKRFIVSR